MFPKGSVSLLLLEEEDPLLVEEEDLSKPEGARGGEGEAKEEGTGGVGSETPVPHGTGGVGSETPAPRSETPAPHV